MNIVGFNESDMWTHGPLVKEFMFNYVAGLSPYVQRSYCKVLSRWIEYCCAVFKLEPSNLNFATCTEVHFGQTTLYREIRSQRIFDFLNTIPAPSMRTIAHRQLHVYFRFLLTAQYISRNPVPNVPLEKRVPKQGPTIPVIEDFVSALSNSAIHIRAPLTVMLAAGLRVNEVCSLRLDDIYPIGENYVVAVRREALKGKSASILPLPHITDTLLEYLVWRDNIDVVSDYMFVDERGKRLDPRKIRRHVQEIGRRAHITPPLNPHDLRRAYATLVAQHITDSELVKRLLRHRRALTSWGYVRLPEGVELQATLKKLACFQLANEFARDCERQEGIDD